jgi:hypothetical protein
MMRKLLKGKRLNLDSWDARITIMIKIEKESRKSKNPINQGSDNFHYDDITGGIIG